ncbi:hypothetical protein AAKU55_003890 [Oxalobacteraceae bacterium GrIS 1.11]
MKQTTEMKRTALARTAFIRKPPQVPATRADGKAASRSGRTARVDHRKKERNIFRSRAYLALVRCVPCVCCGMPGITQAAHSNQLKFGKGRGLKASDASAMALCGTSHGRAGCHATHDHGGKLSKAEWKAFENQNIVATVVALLQLGHLVGDIHDITAPTPPAGFFDFELKAAFLVGMLERDELQIAGVAVKP